MIKTVKTLRVLISHSMPVGPRTGNILFFFFCARKVKVLTLSPLDGTLSKG